ncbi:MAG TPA: nuclear transport factor 2 family protein [Chitinophagaceae bacterium]|nr:nuclear transport factor 2 family protein [Chitinophagaceae bacterium]
MKNIVMLLTAIFFINSLFAQGNVDRTKIKTTIENLNRQMEKVFNANDMAATAAFYSDDAEISGSNYVVTGRKNLDNYWLSLKDRGRGWKLTVIEIGGTDDYIYQLGNSDLTYLVNGKETKSVTNFVLIWKKQKDNSYKIFRDYLTDIEFNKPKK